MGEKTIEFRARQWRRSGFTWGRYCEHDFIEWRIGRIGSDGRQWWRVVRFARADLRQMKSPRECVAHELRHARVLLQRTVTAQARADKLNAEGV